MDDIVAFLKAWKELVGAVIGGVFSLLVALLVAHQARRAEERASAMLLIGELSRVTAMIEQQANGSTEARDVSENVLATHLAEQLCHYRVRLSPLFEASMSRVMNCDTYLAANLTIAFALLRDTEPVLERLEEDIDLINSGKELARPRASVNADIGVVATSYKRVGEHAKFAVRQLEQQVLG